MHGVLCVADCKVEWKVKREKEKRREQVGKVVRFNYFPENYRSVLETIHSKVKKQ